MNQLRGFARDTWWLWLLFAALTAFFAIFVTSFFLLLYPCLLVAFVYFAFNRYDEEGNERADLGT